MIQLLYSRIPAQQDRYCLEEWLALLPPSLRRKNGRLRQVNDKWLHLWGKLLLIEGLSAFGGGPSSLEGLLYDEYNRPYMPGVADFNISHSDEYVLCVISEQLRVGVDIEKIKQVDLAGFEKVMSPEQWDMIRSSADPLRSFFYYWAIKESVIKADSRGMSLPLEDIHISEDWACCDGKNWFLRIPDIDKGYCVCIAAEREYRSEELLIRYVDPLKDICHIMKPINS